MGMLAEGILGVVVGYFLVTLAESVLHEKIQHASPATRAFWRRHPWLCRPLWRAWYSHHVIHHARTYRVDHVTQFESAEEERELRHELHADGHDRIVRERYGLTLGGPSGIMLFVAPVLPVYLVAASVLEGPVVVGMLVPLAVWPLLSKTVHPLLHQSTDEARHATDTSALTRWLASTRLFRRLARYHWMHHKYIRCNYNLLLGGDHLRGLGRSPAPSDLAEMEAIGLRE